MGNKLDTDPKDEKLAACLNIPGICVFIIVNEGGWLKILWLNRLQVLAEPEKLGL